MAAKDECGSNAATAAWSAGGQGRRVVTARVVSAGNDRLTGTGGANRMCGRQPTSVVPEALFSPAMLMTYR